MFKESVFQIVRLMFRIAFLNEKYVNFMNSLVRPPEKLTNSGGNITVFFLQRHDLNVVFHLNFHED